MKREDEYYKKWLGTLRGTQPILDNPDELTAVIMRKVSGTSQQGLSSQSFRISSRKQKVLSVGSWVSVAAAGLLLCLLVGETFFYSVPASVEKEQCLYWNPVTLSLPNAWKAMNTLEKSRYLSSVCQQKEMQRMKKEHFLEDIVKEQAKSTNYESE